MIDNKVIRFNVNITIVKDIIENKLKDKALITVFLG